MNPPNESSSPAIAPTFSQALRFWLKLGFISFGGPTGQIAIMHHELVDRRRWISESRFLHALNYCMLLPGPEAQQLAVYVGWLLHRTLGGLAAGILFVLPSALILWALSYIYCAYGQILFVAAVFHGLKPAVIAIVAAAVIRIGKKALKNGVMWFIAAAAFMAIFFFKAPFPTIILAAGILGLAGGRWRPGSFVVIRPHGAKGGASTFESSVLDDHHEVPDHARPSAARAARVIIVSVILWFGPIAALTAWRGHDDVLVRQGVFFSKAAMVTFGGAYAVLPYVAQQAVDQYNWLTHAQMMDGLGLAETTPGPLIMVVQFVGYLGAWNHATGLSRPLGAALGAAITTWCTFAPCFLWIFLGAPYVEALRGNQRLSAALSTITAAVVGVVLNLAVWFAIHALVPAEGRVDLFTGIVGLASFIAIVRFDSNLILVIIACAGLGLIHGLAF